MGKNYVPLLGEGGKTLTGIVCNECTSWFVNGAHTHPPVCQVCGYRPRMEDRIITRQLTTDDILPVLGSGHEVEEFYTPGHWGCVLCGDCVCPGRWRKLLDPCRGSKTEETNRV